MSKSPPDGAEAAGEGEEEREGEEDEARAGEREAAAADDMLDGTQGALEPGGRPDSEAVREKESDESERDGEDDKRNVGED